LWRSVRANAKPLPRLEILFRGELRVVPGAGMMRPTGGNMHDRETKTQADPQAATPYEPPRLVRLGSLRADLLGHRTGHVKRAGTSDGVSLNRKD
jgi:hypothetical protein